MINGEPIKAYPIFARGITASPPGMSVDGFSPMNLFTSSSIGAFLDLSKDYARFQDAAGTTAATADSAPLGLVYDLKNGVPVLGADIKSTGVVGLVGAATAATYNTSTGAGTATRVDAGNQSYVLFGSLVASSHYVVGIVNTGANPLNIRGDGVGGAIAYTVLAGESLNVSAIATLGRIVITSATSGLTASFTVTSVKLLPGSHAYQTTTTARPLLASSPKRAVFDKSDDNWNIYFPSTITGTLLQSSKEGIIHAEITKTAGVWPVTVTPAYFPSNNICHLIVRNGVMTDAEVAAAKAWMVAQGSGSTFSTVTTTANWFRARTDITKLVLTGLNFAYVTTFAGFALDASNLVTVTVGGVFDALTCTNYTNSFDNCKLNQASMDAILVSINAAGTSNGTLGMTGVNNATPSATGLAAATALRARGWTVTNSKGW